MKIIVDTNIIFSAVLNSSSRIAKILLNSRGHFQFFTCNYLRTEIQRHRNKLLKITGLTEGKLLELEELVMLNITFIDERLIPQDLLVATELQLKNIDPNDTVFVALTKQLQGNYGLETCNFITALKQRVLRIFY